MAAKPIKILGLCGSLRKGSFNAALLRYACLAADKSTCTITVGDIASLPHYNADLQKKAYPEPVEKLRRLAAESDAVLISTPEYNFSVPGVLKNAIDWISRPNIDGSEQPLAGKPAAVMGGGGHAGGLRSQLHLRVVLTYLDMHTINKPEVGIRFYDGVKRIDEHGELTDADTQKRIDALLRSLVSWTRQLESGANAAQSKYA